MNFIKDNPLIYKRILVYIKINSLNDKDYAKIIEGFEKENLRLSDMGQPDILSWLYFRADLFLLNFYYDKYKCAKKLGSFTSKSSNSNKSDYLNQLRITYVGIYCKIVDKHKQYFEEILGDHYKKVCTFSGSVDEDMFLYDLLTLNQEILLYDLVTLNNVKSNIHEKLLFCYKYFLENWNSRKILNNLRKKTLNKIFIDFINEYSITSNLPHVVLLYYFYSLEEDLHKSMKDYSKLNHYFTRIDVWEFIKNGRSEKKLLFKSILDKRLSVIDKWCLRLREKIIENTIEIFKKCID